MPTLYAQQFRKIQQAVNENQYSVAQDDLQQLNIADQAKILERLEPEQQFKLFVRLNEQSHLFEFLPMSIQVQLSTQLPIQHLVMILDGMHSDDFIDLYKKLPEELQKKIYALINENSQHELDTLLDYAEGSAGALMSLDYVTLSPNLTMDEAIQLIRQDRKARETLYLSYIVDESHKLLGIISLREILQAPSTATVQDIMTRDVVFAYVQDDQEDVAKALAHYDFMALPIVDQQKRLLGIVTYDDVMDILVEENTEDMFKSGAVKPIESFNMKTASLVSLYKSRVYWLVILVFGSLLSGFGIAKYEDVIAEHIVLVFFLPLLVGSGGNAGSQSATLMVRALATGDVEFKDWFYLIGRECVVALALGTTMAVAVSILGYIRGDVMVAIVLAISMTGIVMLGCLIGMSLPFILKKMNMDPASASAPLVTSICDATGVIVYLFVASLLLF